MTQMNFASIACRSALGSLIRSFWPPSTWTPNHASRLHSMTAPRRNEIEKVRYRMRAAPAGSEITWRTTGSSCAKNTPTAE